MHYPCKSLALVSGLLFSVLSAHSQLKPTTPDAYAGEAVVFERVETAYKMHADGTGERDLSVRMRVQSEGAAQQFGVFSFPYASAYETHRSS